MISCKHLIFPSEFYNSKIIISIEAGTQKGWEWGVERTPQWGTLKFVPFNIVREIIFRRLKWVGHVARIEEGRSAFKILTGRPIGKRDLWGGLNVDERQY